MAKKKRKKVASRGSVNNIILQTLISGDKYGYEIIKNVEEFSDGKIQLKQPSLYSSLTRFEERSFVSSYWGDSDIGGRRHYYHLTPKGLEYYQKEVLKKDDASVLENDDPKRMITTISDNSSETQAIKNELIEEIDSDSIPATISFDNTHDVMKTENSIPDHYFHKSTPIEKAVTDSNITAIDDQTNVNNNINKIDDLIDDSVIWMSLANKVKINNKIISNSPNKKFHYIKPKKSQVVILDSDGIYKLRDKDYTPSNKVKQTTNVIDNVVKRIENKNFGYSSYTDDVKHIAKSEDISDEERQKRKENFLAKFNLISKSRMKEEVKSPAPNIPQKEIDYRSKLDIVSHLNDIETTPIENNLFNYINEDDEKLDEVNANKISSNDVQISFDNNGKEDVDDKFINFDPVEFETKTENKAYVDKINNFSQENDRIKISHYENKSTAILMDKQYVLINKVKCLFGFILLLMFILEISISMYILKDYGLIHNNDKIVFIMAYIITGLIAIAFMVPILFNPKMHKINSFKLKYSMIFGILTFLVCVILIYCLNTLIGFEIDNFQFFAVKIIIPIILVFNFVITPPIYALIIKCKKFYD